jgi:Ca2+/Na+ antiporter
MSHTLIREMLHFRGAMILVWGLLIVVGVVFIVWGAETFAEHLGAAAVRLQVSSFALALLLAGAEPEELATAFAASLRDAPAIAFGDVVGANIAICLVALGVGAWIAPLPFSKRVMRYALFGLPIGVIATGFVWDGEISRLEGLFLIGLYVLYVAVIWWVERKPPALGETGELEEASEELATEQAKGIQRRVGKELLLVFAGFASMIVGSSYWWKLCVKSAKLKQLKPNWHSRSLALPPLLNWLFWLGQPRGEVRLRRQLQALWDRLLTM